MIRKVVVQVDDVETGAAIRALREDKGESVRSIARALKITPMSLSLYERGCRGIKPSMAKRIVTAIFDTAGLAVPKHFRLAPGDEE